MKIAPRMSNLLTIIGLLIILFITAFGMLQLIKRFEFTKYIFFGIFVYFLLVCLVKFWKWLNKE